MARLFILVSDGGDGSYYPKFTMNANLVSKLQDAYINGQMDYENGIGCDGDGFHYEIMNVPDGSTAESMGIRLMDDDYADQFNGEADD